ncbi:uncharacterized protein LOC110061982, partial [Orbicella faveolata]|uniref:uncharacterized protein LOC110061982 n=1 Tax=Orbicella faveolata TaxID=48498 RepID=UPI0009E362DE
MNLPICRIAVEASRYNRHSQQLGETVMAVYAVLIIFLVSYVVNKIDATSYASLSSADENFKLQWTYNSSKFIFKMTCKTTGWCAVGFTTTADGRGMVDYDIAVAGYASSAGYIDDRWSISRTQPSNDTEQNFNLMNATEQDGQTMVEFSRDALTGDTANDVQFKNDTEVKVVYAYNTSSDANGGLRSKHTNRGILDGKHNLILMAISAMQPSSTMMPPT